VCDRTVRRLLLVESPHDPTRTMSSPTPRTALLLVPRVMRIPARGNGSVKDFGGGTQRNGSKW
jgi:hypothetical protein